MAKKRVTEDLLKDRRRLVKLSIEMENDFSNEDIIPRKGRMSILFFLGITENDRFFFFREDISQIDRANIIKISTENILANIEPNQQILISYDCDEYYWGATYIFVSPPKPNDFLDVVVLEEDTDPIFAIEKDKKIVSKAWTWGENHSAAEVEVETVEGYRGRGYARQTVSAWAAWQMKKKKIAFFSHEFANYGSRRLASKLNLVKIASIFIFYERGNEILEGGKA
jgi:hypothetical protein